MVKALRDWLVQQVSAVLMAVYFIGMLAYFVMHPDISYADWHALFACSWMKVGTVLVILSLSLHAWIGIWTVMTDYVKPVLLRTGLEILVILALAAFFFAALFILWGV